MDFATGVSALADEAGKDATALADAARLPRARVEALLTGAGPEPTLAEAAALCLALGQQPLDFLQRAGYITAADYAGGLDPLFFMPEGGARNMLRIALRERHNNPKGILEENVLRRNTALRSLQDDRMLTDVQRTELVMRYLLFTAGKSQ